MITLDKQPIQCPKCLEQAFVDENDVWLAMPVTCLNGHDFQPSDWDKIKMLAAWVKQLAGAD
jgi:hypothetical protein